MNWLIKHAYVWATAALLAGCVHEFPEKASPPPEDVSFTLHLVFDLELPPYKEIIYTSDGSRHNPSEIYDLRYVVNIYRSLDNNTFSRQPDSTLVVLKDEIETFNYDMPMRLPPGYYNFMVWADYSNDGSTDDRYYSTGNFASIELLGQHVGNDDYRDAFRGVQDVFINDELPADGVTVLMHRPLGKFRFIATDYDRFLTRAEEAARAEYDEARAAYEASRDEDPSLSPPALPPINLEDYTVLFRYPGFMPHIFNMHTNRPADAKTGVTFEGRIANMTDTEAELGFDYVFVNGEEAPVSVSVEVYNKSGALVGSSGAITVPLMRSMLTTVKGEFLTSKASGGVGVSPEFDGEFNIVIP